MSVARAVIKAVFWLVMAPLRRFVLHCLLACRHGGGGTPSLPPSLQCTVKRRAGKIGEKKFGRRLKTEKSL